jgi:phage-related protein
MKMKIPKAFHPILGVLTGTILFLAGIAVLSAVFVGTYKAIQYAKPFVSDVITNILNYLSQWLPL